MTSRGRANSTGEWDTLRDEFNDTVRNLQYPEEESEEVRLDYTKLYVTKLPVALARDGFMELFGKYGNVVHAYLSKDPQKKYAFVTFETAGEARIAKMKLNRTEPFCMNIVFAHLKNSPAVATPPNVKSQSNSEHLSRQHSSIHHSVSNADRQSDRQQSFSNLDKHHSSIERHSIDKHSSVGKQSSMDKHSSIDRNSQKVREDCSTSSQNKQRNADDHVNGEEMEGTEGSDSVVDPKFEYDMEQIKLQRLQLKEQQLLVQERMLIHQQKMKNNSSAVTKRRLLPDGRSIQVTQDETSFTAGAGDSNNIPGLQREASRHCVGCGAAAEQYCSGCLVTPYCGERCQRRDWEARHGAVCHNLARSAVINGPIGQPEAPTLSALRRPHSPVNVRAGSGDKEKVATAPGQNFIPPAELHNAQQRFQRNKFQGVQRIQEQSNQPQPRANGGSQDRNHAREGKDFKTSSPNHNRMGGRSFQQAPRQPLRQPAMPQRKPADETDNVPVATKPDEATKPVVATKAEATKPVVTTKSEAIKPVVATKAEATKPEVPKSEPLMAVTLASVTPRKPLVPSSFILQKIEAGTIFAATVIARATEAASKQTGFVCLMINEDVLDVYNQLCDEFSMQCEKEKEGYIPSCGETFAYKDDEGWYRARCLAPTRGALLDAGRIVSFEPSVCRKLPSAYASVPEFVAVIQMEGLEIGASLSATVVSTSAHAVKVTVVDESGIALGEADAAKWATIVEYPQEPEEPQPDLSEPKSVEPKKIPEPVKIIPGPVKNIPEPVKIVQEAPKPVIRKPLVPDSYVVGNLKVNDMFLAQVGFFDESERGFVCVTVHADSTDAYSLICEDFPLKCSEDKVQYTPAIGETFAFLNKEDEGWYRARCLSRTRACLLDMAMFATFDASVCRKLPIGYADIPEFVAVIKSDKLEADSNVECVVISTSPTETKVRIQGIDGEYHIKRWTPPMEYPVEPAAAAVVTPAIPTAATPTIPTAATPAIATTATTGIPTLLRPCLEHNSLYILCSVTSLARACVRQIGSQELFDAALHDTVSYGLNAKPLTEPAQKGQIVVAKFSEDGLCYRAFVKRVNVAKNKYLVEYVEYGNEEIVKLESLYPCPPKLSLEAMPPQASLVRLSEVDAPLTPAATAYTDRLKDNSEHLILTIPGGEKTKVSGSLVNLLIAKNCEPASQKIEDLCLHKLFYADITSRFTPFSAKGGPVTLTLPYCDANLLANGNFAGYEKGDENAPKIFEELSQKLQEYGERAGKASYRPTEREELCIAKNCRVNKWERAVVIDLDEAGAKDPQLMFLDHGNVEDVPPENIMKMVPEFIEQYSVVTRQFDIKDFPVETVTEPQIVRAMRFMKVTPAGRGELTVRAVLAVQNDTFEVHAPELLQALTE